MMNAGSFVSAAEFALGMDDDSLIHEMGLSRDELDMPGGFDGVRIAALTYARPWVDVLLAANRLDNEHHYELGGEG